MIYDLFLKIPYLNLIAVKIFEKNSSFFFETTFFYLILSVILLVFSFPFLLISRDRFINFLKIYILGFINLLVLLSLSTTLYINIKIAGILPIIVILTYIVETIIIVVAFKKRAIILFLDKINLTNVKYFILISIIHFFLFIILTANFYNQDLQKYFVPGYQINHDSMSIISSIKIFNNNFLAPNNSGYDIGKSIINVYPMGGTTFVSFFSQLFRIDPYIIYQRILVYIYLLLLFPIFNYLKSITTKYNTSILVIILAAFNYLSLSIVNTSVLASSLAIPILLLLIFKIIEIYKTAKLDKHDGIEVTLAIYSLIFLYSYFLLFYIAVAIIIGGFLYKKKVLSLILIFIIFVSITFALIEPSTRSGLINLALINFTSKMREANILGGMMGNTISFINPLTVISLWYYNNDFRFALGTIDNYWIATFLLFPLFYFKFNQEKIKYKKNYLFQDFVLLSVVFGSLIIFTYFVTKSPYQNVKALHYMAIIWPLLIYLILHETLMSTNKLKKLIVILYFLIYFLFALKSAMLSYVYIGKPFFGSNYELMAIEKTICNNNKSKVYIGRDEWSRYFLNSCSNITYLYNRMENLFLTLQFFESNKIDSLNTECNNRLFIHPTVDYKKYTIAIVDKCFLFDSHNYILVKDLKYHRVYEKIN